MQNINNKIVLDYPVKLANGQTLTEINLRRPVVRDLKNAQNISSNAADEELSLLATLSREKLVKEDLEELDLSDYMKLQEWFRGVSTPKTTAAASGSAASAVVSVSAK